MWIGRCRGGARFIPLQCARPNVLGIQPWSSNDRPPWLQSCRDNIPCTHDQAINEHVSDMLWGHGGQGKSGRRPGEGWRPFAVTGPMCWAFGSRGPSTDHYCSNLAETTPHARMTKPYMNMSMIGCGYTEARGVGTAPGRGEAPLGEVRVFLGSANCWRLSCSPKGRQQSAPCNPPASVASRSNWLILGRYLKKVGKNKGEGGHPPLHSTHPPHVPRLG